MKTTQHTPTPWTFSSPYTNGAGSFKGPDGKGIACISAAIRREENQANAAFIVTACNAHDALVAALQIAANFIMYPDSRPSREVLDTARAALAKVTP